MELNLHTDLGLRSLLVLAARHPDRVSAAEIAERHRVSFAHVQKVVQALQRHGFVHTHRGRGGGIELARPADQLTVGAVVRALEPLALVECFDPARDRCVLSGACGLAGALHRAREAFLRELDGVTLADAARPMVELRHRLGLPAVHPPN